MRKVTVTLRGLTPYGQSKYIQAEKNPKETHAAYEERTWRDRMHIDSDGYVFIPPMSFKNCVSEAAKYLSIQIPGKGKSTYTKHFEAGIMVVDPVRIHNGTGKPILASDVNGLWLHVPSDGKRGGTKRVRKCFPVIQQWSGTVTFLILDETITREVFEEHLKQAGQFIGLGFFRPRNNGYYGRFVPENYKWE